jgi:hypothetical protein
VLYRAIDSPVDDILFFIGWLSAVIELEVVATVIEPRIFISYSPDPKYARITISNTKPRCGCELIGREDMSALKLIRLID